jgi:hypothetical protein
MYFIDKFSYVSKLDGDEVS